MVRKITTAGLAPGTIKTRLVNVRSVLRAAIRDRIIAQDPSEGVSGPRGRRRDAAMSIPTTEQVAALLDAVDDRYEALLALAAFAGLRLGEAAGVQIGDVDFLRRRSTVVRQVQRTVGGTVEVRSPKYASERVVFLPDALVTLLTGHVAAHRPGGDPTRWLFEASPGRPHCMTSAHFYASGLIAAGCDVVTVQRALGHAKATATLNTYAHLWPTAEDRTRAASGDLMAAALWLPADSPRTEPPV